MRSASLERICGGEHVLAWTIASFESLSRVNPRPFEVYIALARENPTLDELRAALGAALAAGGSRLGADEVIEREGWARACDLAASAMQRGLAPPEEDPEAGKPSAGAETAAGTETASSASGATSASAS